MCMMSHGVFFLANNRKNNNTKALFLSHYENANFPIIMLFVYFYYEHNGVHFFCLCLKELRCYYISVKTDNKHYNLKSGIQYALSYVTLPLISYSTVMR